ncbi:hypothetical protein QFC22_004292 [Naganishia vaughanmartiniae]|uniref:Uncharacterized protein n=1 Tax=Naganishia vaughanmartiniae TaxID=1424756 RepID=A0ACC2X0Q8_9TREE|nr:hypothetical protein QFC22_004292 [Naganishia vaughanmartiniae]
MPGAEYWTDDYWVNHPPDDPSFNWRWPVDYYRRFVSNSGYVEDSFVSPGVRVPSIDRTFNPAEIDTYTPDLTAFFKRGGKVIQYTGWNDDRGGNGAWLFGGHGQRSKAYYPDEEPWDGTCYQVSTKKQYRYLHLLHDYDKEQTGPVNVQAALVDWVEKGVPVDHLIATNYEPAPDQLSVKVNYTRKLCPVKQGRRIITPSL